MSTDTRTAGEKQRDNAGPMPAHVTHVSLKEAMAMKAEMERKQQAQQPQREPIRLSESGEMTPYQPPTGPSNGLHAGMPGYVPTVWTPPLADARQIPQATPLTLVDAAVQIVEGLRKLADNLTGSAEWCEQRAKEMADNPLQQCALLQVAKIMREDAKRSTATSTSRPNDPEEEIDGNY